MRGTTNHGILYRPCSDPKLIAYSDSDWGGSQDDMNSTSGYAFSFGSGVFLWISKKQEVVAQSLTEAEYIVASATTNQVVWLRKIFADMGFKQDYATDVFVDNKSAISISKKSSLFQQDKTHEGQVLCTSR